MNSRGAEQPGWTHGSEEKGVARASSLNQDCMVFFLGSPVSQRPEEIGVVLTCRLTLTLFGIRFCFCPARGG